MVSTLKFITYFVTVFYFHPVPIILSRLRTDVTRQTVYKYLFPDHFKLIILCEKRVEQNELYRP